ncbi:MAG: 30S ribosome-binding factor RbfA [Pirellulales bacterium]|nr:30S ribosome-binding factor RbfA [Pirellulales bacterium]
MSRRLLKAAEAIREVVSMAILAEMRDPRVIGVTVIGVDVAPDMRSAKVMVSIMGSEKKQARALAALQGGAGFLQSRIAEKIDTRYTPRLTFVLDKGVKQSLEVLKILKQVLPPEGESAAQSPAVPGDAMSGHATPPGPNVSEDAHDVDPRGVPTSDDDDPLSGEFDMADGDWEENDDADDVDPDEDEGPDDSVSGRAPPS